MRRTKLVMNSHCIPRMCVGVQYMCLKTFTPAGDEIVHSSDLSNSNCFAREVPCIKSKLFPTFGELVVTLLKILTRTRNRVISKDIRPAIVSVLIAL